MIRPIGLRGPKPGSTFWGCENYPDCIPIIKDKDADVEIKRMELRLAVTFAEAADLLTISQQTIRQLVDQGDLPVVKNGRAKRIAIKDLEQLLEDKKVVQRHKVHIDPKLLKEFNELLGIKKRP